MAHLGFLGECHIDQGLGYIDDVELIAVMYRHKAELFGQIAGDSERFAQADWNRRPRFPEVQLFSDEEQSAFLFRGRAQR